MSIVDFDDITWSDPWIRKLSPTQKLLFFYLWTNRHRMISGVYQIDRDVIAFETGLTGPAIDSGLEALRPKVLHDPENSLVFVVNYVKRQFCRTGQTSPKIKKAIESALTLISPRGHVFIKEFLARYSFLEIPYQYPSDTVSGGYSYPPSGGAGKGKGQERGIIGGNGEERASISVQDKKGLFAEKFWPTYPTRDGRKVNRREAERLFLAIPDEDLEGVLSAVVNYAKSKTAREGFAKDPDRFLKKDFWRDWTAAPEAAKGRAGRLLDALNPGTEDPKP